MTYSTMLLAALSFLGVTALPAAAEPQITTPAPTIGHGQALLAEHPPTGLSGPAALMTGRYRLHQSDNYGLILLDTTSGRCWQRVGSGWSDWGLPAVKSNPAVRSAPRPDGARLPPPKPIDTDKIFDVPRIPAERR